MPRTTDERRRRKRVPFSGGYPARLAAADGPWQKACRVEDVSDTGTKLTIDGSLDGLEAREFVLLLSSRGPARQCERVWLRENSVGGQVCAALM